MQLRAKAPRRHPGLRSESSVQSQPSPSRPSVSAGALGVGADRRFSLGDLCRPFFNVEEPGRSTSTELGWKTGGEFADDYLPRSLIGSGSFGKVYSAVSKSSGLEVAIKTMTKVRGQLTREKTLDKIRRETSFLQRLQACPTAVRLIDRAETAQEAHLVTELCRGGDLRNLVESHGSLDEHTLASVAFQALTFIKSCHELGLLYGDLKPANFCLMDVYLPRAQTVTLKAIDFGTSQNCSYAHRLSKWTGTLTFLSPEVYAQNYGHKADMWSLGVTLYWAYCRRFPFWESPQPPARCKMQDMADVVARAPITYDFGPWPHMSPEGLDFIQRCLTRDESQRLSATDALQHPWFAYWCL